ncbi:MAG: tol-pal system protein YbgF [Paraglaciecola sp.]|uniref:tol-pal system protein YbgF n=1 Tax=Pseudomonadati TaxID=3379134 RepID=UPI00273ED00F|nr:tol-pal system protein YbgF [Paraglaciecola sp.]MDP5032705.1 tol-pal system protein YbgF [Paraglaciecola sp.]MDP5132186.1 tol-pal system protein YbgF [Paraglaciecola sp.]
MIKRTFALSLLSVYGAALFAAPAPVADVTSGSNDQRIEALERMFATRTEAQHRLQQQLDVMQQEVNELRGSIELHNYQLERILDRQRELYAEIDKRMSNLSQAPSAAPIETDDNGSSSANSAVLSENENEAYDKAVNLILKDKLYDQAIPAFQSFLQTYPNSSYASNAHYWLGQLLFNKQDWAGASGQFQALVTNFPDSSKRADAILKLGITEIERANSARAKQLWEQVLKEYPNSPSSKLAEKRLKNL